MGWVSISLLLKSENGDQKAKKKRKKEKRIDNVYLCVYDFPKYYLLDSNDYMSCNSPFAIVVVGEMPAVTLSTGISVVPTD